jgi:eukaryotic-like serine/threonine-protein kinase
MLGRSCPRGLNMTSDDELVKAKRIFDRATELPFGERAAFVERECAGSIGLNEQIKRMLANFATDSGSFGPVVGFETNQTQSDTELMEFSGTDRFRVQTKLGSGGFGTVYEVFDRKWHATLALKVLNRIRPDSLYRFKQEFRALSRLRHENLIQLYEFFAEDQRWFFTMQLLHGQSFLRFVRGTGRVCDIDRLRTALRQLVVGVECLHRSNHIHRDLKPGNVLVTKTGRVVVLDFGLVRDLSSENGDQTASFVGTPGYMSPEQSLQRPLGPASDWYSVGVMFFQALTGELPSTAVSGVNSDQLEPQLIDLDVPEEMKALCLRMLDPSPENRPTGAEILASLRSERSETPAETEVPREIGAESFFGRTEQLETVNAAFAEMLKGQPNVVLIEGPSGIGKSTLVRHFLAEVAQRLPQILVLTGRCHEFESVPYKGLDSLIDKLAQYLQRLPNARVQELLPREAFLLRKLFPVLGRVRAIANAPVASDLVPDQQELRQRTFSALRELMARLGDRNPLVIWIDDLQWGDRDSSSFLAELCAPPLPPRLLLLLSYRSEESDSNSTLSYLSRVFTSNNKILGSWRHVDLSGLPDEDSRNLVKSLLPQVISDSVVRKIVVEARGHPYYLRELARRALRTGRFYEDIAERDIELRTFLQSTISELPVCSREFLELTSLAVQPIPVSLVFAASVSDQKEEQFAGLGPLIDGNLVRVSGGEGEQRIEPYHDYVRKVVVESLSPEIARARHSQLAKQLAEDLRHEPQLLVTHYKGAGDLVSALAAAVKAGGAAELQLAFDRAAMFYQAAIDTGAVEDSRKGSLYQRLADCLGKAGRGWDSAGAYLKAAEYAENDSFELKRLAADQLMRSGHLDQAMVLFRDLSRRIGLKMPTNPVKAMWGIFCWRLLTRMRLCIGYPKSLVGTIANSDRTRLELLRTGGVIMNTTDPVLAAYLQARHVYTSLRVREAHHLAIAIAVEGIFRASSGVRTPEKPLKLMQVAEQRAKVLGDSNTLGLVYLCRAYIDHVLGRIPQGIENSRFTIAFLRGHCTGMAWELTAAHVLLFWFTLWAGNPDEVRELFPQLLREGAARGDVNVENSLRFLSYYYLSADRPDECLNESIRVLDSSGSFQLQHFGAALTCVETHLYLGDYTSARKWLLKVWAPLSKSFILRWQIFRILTFFLRGRVALASWLVDRRNSLLRAEVEYYAKRLKRIQSAWCHPMAGILTAGLFAGGGNTADAVQALEEAHDGFEKLGIHGYASAATHVCGLLRGDEKGYAQIRNAEEFFKIHEFRNPTAFLRMLIPGKWN